MKTYFYTYLFIVSVFLIYWLWEMFSTKPTFKHETENRFICNWNEGGKILFFLILAIAIPLAFCIAKAILLLNFLER